MRGFCILVVACLLVLSGCSISEREDYIVDTLNEQFDKNINPDLLTKVDLPNRVVVIYPDGEQIHVYVFQGKENVHTTVISLDELHENNIFWQASEDGENKLFSIFGAISKNNSPHITVNDEPFTGNIISLDEAYIFFSFYDAPLPLPVDIKLSE